jgi:hypothetical protein
LNETSDLAMTLAGLAVDLAFGVTLGTVLVRNSKIES